MFDGVPEQLHQFIASSRTTLPLPSLSFSSLHHHHQHHQDGSSNPNNTTIFPTFDPFTSATNSSQVPLQVQPSFLHPFTNQQSQPQKSSEEKQAERDSLVGIGNNLEMDIERSERNINPPSWSNDEVLALLRIRSSLDNWFPESTWEHASRKLEELGYKRSAEKCKEKFEEEESRYLSNINYNKSQRFFNEFEDFYSNSTHGQNPDENSKNLEKSREEEEQQQEGKNLLDGLNGEYTTKEKDQTLMNPLEEVREKLVASRGEKKRKWVQQQKVKDHDRDHHDDDNQLEMLKGFCEDIVKKMMVQQEEMHLKLIEDMVKRDEEKVAREEAWKKQEMDRVNKELEIRVREQAIACDRQATLIKFLKSFTSSSSSGSSSSHEHHHHHHQNQCFEDRRSSEESPVKVLINNSPSSSLILAQNTNDHQVANHDQVHNPSSNLDNPKEPPTSQNPNSPNIVTKKKPLSPTSVSTQIKASSNDKDYIGKRWPRDEVLALINLRCSLQNNGSDHHHHQDKEGQAKIPLWERISQGMLELGYKRSAKRCKEKWENINKYFRKTKDVNKKRSLDSRTCPYFHQLSTLYNQGTLVASSEAGTRPATLLENNLTPSENHPGSSQAGSSSDSTMQVGHDQQGEKILVQVPTFDFEF